MGSMLIKIWSQYWALALVIVAAAIVRLSFVGSVPYGFANDEVSYILSGYTISHNGGVDIAGKFLPLSINLDSSLSPVPVYIISLFTFFFGLSPAIARLPFALPEITSTVSPERTWCFCCLLDFLSITFEI